jgi:excinuclease ABC subunit C
VFDANGPRKSDYRRFNITGVTPGDDYAAMEQALRRRYARVQAGEVDMPDLIVIDGGQGQLARAISILEELGLASPTLLGIAKGPTRKPGLERFFLAEGEVFIPPHGDAALLLQQIRDEAHRFAITGHRQRRQKVRRSSELEAIPGVGAKRRRELITHFGGVRALKGASVEEIAKVPGISHTLAQTIYGILHAE